MTDTPTAAAAAHSDHTYALAERLRGIATDSLYTFQPGIRELRIDTLPEDLQLIGRFTTHTWGISAQLWARDEQGALQASGEATAGPIDKVSSIHARIKHFRSDPLLWTHIGPPITAAPISSLHGTAYTTLGRHCYEIHPEPRIGAHPIWHLAEDLELEHPLFAGVTSAVTYIADQFETPTGRPRARTTSAAAAAAAHPWRR